MKFIFVVLLLLLFQMPALKLVECCYLPFCASYFIHTCQNLGSNEELWFASVLSCHFFFFFALVVNILSHSNPLLSYFLRVGSPVSAEGTNSRTAGITLLTESG